MHIIYKSNNLVMEILQFLKLSLIFVLFCKFTKSEVENQHVKYTLLVSNNNNKFTKTEITETVVRTNENAWLVKIVNELPVLKKGLLQLFNEVSVLEISDANLTEIEPGSFDEQNITNIISLRNNELTVLRTGTMRNLQIGYVCLANNKIAHIEKDAITNMPHLFNIDLSSNKLIRLGVQSFVNTPKMTIIYLDENYFTKITKRNFDFMNNTIRLLSVRDNEIDEIHFQALEFKIVETILLGNNKIKHIPEEIFIDSKVETIELQNNELELLPESFFKQTTLSMANLLNNPLRCEVLEQLKEAVKNTKILIRYDAEKVC
jgi:Leucine-rich repeat (LRR) protein